MRNKKETQFICTNTLKNGENEKQTRHNFTKLWLEMMEFIEDTKINMM